MLQNSGQLRALAISSSSVAFPEAKSNSDTFLEAGLIARSGLYRLKQDNRSSHQMQKLHWEQPGKFVPFAIGNTCQGTIVHGYQQVFALPLRHCSPRFSEGCLQPGIVKTAVKHLKRQRVRLRISKSDSQIGQSSGRVLGQTGLRHRFFNPLSQRRPELH